MNIIRLIACGGLCLGLAACGGTDTTTRNIAMQLPPEGAQVQAQYRIADFTIRVPRALRVSEANRYYPGGDIVWRGEPLGDRHAQVAEIFRESLEMASVQAADGKLPVKLDIEVKRFHALTEKARYTVGGVHAITFDLTVLDSETGAPLGPTRTVRADLDGFGGERAINAERNGITQKYRITHHLARVFQVELVNPDGYRNANLGLIQAINQL